MIYFSHFGTADTSLYGVLAYRSGTDDSDTGASHYNSEAYDVGGWHTTGGSNENFTVPSGVSFARFIVNNRRSGGTISTDGIEKGGAAFNGTVYAHSDTPGGDTANSASAIVAVSASDVFAVNPGGTSTGGDYTQVDSWFAAEAISSTRKMAHVRKSANEAISAGTTTTLAWGSETRDTDSWHDTVTNNSRLTVPSGVSLVRIAASLVASAGGASTQFVLSAQKGGASVPGLFQKDGLDTNTVSAVSAILAVSAGEYFECRAFHTSAVNINQDSATWFQIEEIDAATKYALVAKSGNQALSATTFTAIAFGAETADTSSFHDNSTNNSRLTIPAGQGITQARLSFNVTTPSTAGQFIGEVRKNGSSSAVPGLPRQETDTAGTDNINGFGAWVDVVAGDYFELFCYSDNAQTLAVADTTWFCIETR